MLYLVGTGLAAGHLTLDGKTAVENCSKAYVEGYTNKLSSEMAALEELVGKKVAPLTREDVEVKIGNVLKEAKTEDVAILVIGDVFTATTHSDLMLRAKKEKVHVKVVPGVSIYTVAPGLSGLQIYKFGRSTTIVYPLPNYSPESFYDAIKDNKAKGLHTLCLLDLKINSEEFKGVEKLMTAREAAKILLDIALKRGELKDAEQWLFTAVCAAGGEKEKVFFGRLKDFLKLEYDEKPQTMIALGKLHEVEKEFIEGFAEKVK